MRHNKAFQKLSRTPAHRKALFRNLATALVLKDSIKTTLVKAKELKRVADKLVTYGKRNTLHSRRLAMAYLIPVNREIGENAQKLSAVHRLFNEIAPRYSGRDGGYTRVVRLPKRQGDKAPMAVIQFVEGAVEKKAKRQRRVVKKAAAQEAAAEK